MCGSVACVGSVIQHLLNTSNKTGYVLL